jgi:hypothetical protein
MAPQDRDFRVARDYDLIPAAQMVTAAVVVVVQVDEE